MVNEHMMGNKIITADGPTAATQEARPVSASLSDRVRSLRLPEKPKQPRSRSALLAWTLCGLFGVTTSVFAFMAMNPSKSEADKTATDKLSGTSSGTSAGRTEDAIASSGEVTLESKGYIIAAHRIQVSPKVSGMLMQSNIEEGRRVQKGDVLAVFETVDYQSDYDHAVAVLEAARQRLQELTRSHQKEIDQCRAEVDESEAQRKQLRADWKRSYTLRTGSALADREYEQSESSFRAMDQRVKRLSLALELMERGPRLDRIEATKAEIRQAEADVAKAKWRLDNCTVRAPVSGTILTKDAEEGNIVNQLSLNLKGSLCDMADLSDLEVELDIQERDIAKVTDGQPCRVRPEAFPDRIYDGVVSRLMPIADRAKGAVKVRVKLTVPKEEEGVYLKPDMGAIVSFMKRQKTAGAGESAGR